MIRFSRFLLTVFCLASLLLAFQGTAQAYVDPGQGLLALQILGSTMAGVGFYFRRKIGKYFVHRPKTPVASRTESNHPELSIEPKPE